MIERVDRWKEVVKEKDLCEQGISKVKVGEYVCVKYAVGIIRVINE